MYYSQSDTNTISCGCGGCGVCGSGGVRGDDGGRGGGGGGDGGGATAVVTATSDLTRFPLRNLNFLKLYFSLHLGNYIHKF